MQTGKEEVKMSLFPDDMTLYIENTEDATRKLLGLINEFSKVQNTKLIYRNLLHFCTLMNYQKLSEREIKETIPFTISHQKE